MSVRQSLVAAGASGYGRGVVPDEPSPEPVSRACAAAQKRSVMPAM